MEYRKLIFLFKFIDILLIFNGGKCLISNSSSNIFHLKLYTYNINISSSLNKNDPNPLIIWSYNELYTIIPFGEDKRSLYALLSDSDHGFYLIDGYGTFNSEYNISDSVSFKRTSNNYLAYKSFHYGMLATENFYLLNEKDEEVKIEDFQIVGVSQENQIKSYFLEINDIKPEYRDNYNIHNITFSILGLELSPRYRYEMLDNFIVQLKKKKYINNYFWSLNYDNNDIEGNLIIGKLPECYNDSNIYKEVQSLPYNMGLQWDFSFKNIFFYSNNNSEIFIAKEANTVNAIINFNYGLITATMDYYYLIKEHYFNYYLNNSICFENKTNLKEGINQIYFYCDKNKFNVNDMINFPELYFYHVEFVYKFMMNYEKIFKIYGDYVYFLIVFDKTSKVWTLGKIFLNQKDFYYNHDTKMIGFCSYLEEKKEEKEEKSNSIVVIAVKIMIIILLIIILVLIIVFIIKLYKKYCIHKRHLRNNEIEFEVNYSDNIND